MKEDKHIFTVVSGYTGDKLTLECHPDMDLEETQEVLEVILRFLTWSDDQINMILNKEEE